MRATASLEENSTPVRGVIPLRDASPSLYAGLTLLAGGDFARLLDR